MKTIHISVQREITGISINGYIEMIKILLENKITINPSHFFSLLGQINSRSIPDAKKIIDIFASNIDINSTDTNTNTALHYICNSPLSLTSTSPKIILIQDRPTDAIKHLFSQNIKNINQENNQGFTPLHFAAKNGYVSIVHFLMQNNAKILKNSNGKTPLDLAKHEKENYLNKNDKQKYEAIIQELQHHFSKTKDLSQNNDHTNEVVSEDHNHLSALSKDPVLNTATQEDSMVDSILTSTTTSDDAIASSSNALPSDDKQASENLENEVITNNNMPGDQPPPLPGQILEDAVQDSSLE